MEPETPKPAPPGLPVLLQEIEKTQSFALELPDSETKVPAFAVPNGEGGMLMRGVDDIVRAYEKVRPEPFRRRGIYKAADLTSMLAWMENNCVAASPIFASGAEKLAGNWKAPDLTFIGIANYSDGDKTAWHDLRVEYPIAVTDAWKVW